MPFINTPNLKRVGRPGMVARHRQAWFPLLAGLTSLGFVTSRFPPDFFFLPEPAPQIVHIAYGLCILVISVVILSGRTARPIIHQVLSPLAVALYLGKSLAVGVRLLDGESYHLAGGFFTYLVLVYVHQAWHAERVYLDTWTSRKGIKA